MTGPSSTPSRTTARTASRPRRVVPATPRLEARAKAARSQRRGRVLHRISNTLAVLLPLVALGWILMASTWLGVDRVEVRGVERLTSEQVVQAVAVDTGTPLARVDTSAVEGRVAELAPVADVAVRRTWPGTLTVEVTERTPAAAVGVPGGVRLLDATGVPFADQPTFPKGLVRLEVAAPAAGDPATAAAVKVYAGLPPALRERVGIVRASSPAAIELLLYDGRRVVWGGPDQGGTKAAAALALMTKPGSVFDVSAGNVVVVK